MALSEELRRRREELVVEHMESENRHEFDVTLGTFDHPRYELIGTHHSDDAVIVEANLYGTHDGPFRGLPPTGRKFEMRFCAIFVFDDDRLVCERVYFDSGTVLRQLGIARDPVSVSGRVATVLNHPVTIGRAVAGQLFRR